jgi:hypothetical protein
MRDFNPQRSFQNVLLRCTQQRSLLFSGDSGTQSGSVFGPMD